MTWLPVVGYEGKYVVNEIGQVKGLRNNKILSAHPGKDGYLRVAIYGHDGKRHPARIHTMVLYAFEGPRPPGMEGRHLDGDKNNCALSNLAWGTSAENKADMIRLGRHANTRKTHCPKNHPYDEENTYRYPDGRRQCRTCTKQRHRVQII